MSKIPLLEPCIEGREWEYVKECFDTNWVSSAGKYVEKFENRLADYVGARYGVATVNGTAALHTALKVLGIQEGDKVLVPSLTFIASVNPIRYCNAVPVFVDSERQTFNVDPERVVNKIESMISNGNKPKAIIVVHLFGHPAQLDPIVEICRQNNIFIIEDATEALGAEYKGRTVGNIGDIGCFSFNGNKLITTGGGGMLVTDNQNWAKRARYLTTQAKDDPKNYIHKEIGYNYRLTNLQAAMGVAQLERVDDFIVRKREIAHKYNKKIDKIPGIKISQELDWAKSNFWLYSTLVNENIFGIKAKKLYKELNKVGIMARPFFKPIHHMPMYKKYDANIVQADELWEQGISLPSSVGITDDEIDKIIYTLKEIRGKGGK